MLKSGTGHRCSWAVKSAESNLKLKPVNKEAKTDATAVTAP